MATPASRTVQSSPNPAAQGSPRSRDWSNLKPGEPGTAFPRGRGSRINGVKGGRGGGRPPSNSGQKGGSHSDTANISPSPSPKVLSAPRKHPAPISTAVTPNGTSEKAVNGSTERGGRPKSGSRRQPRSVPAVVVAPASPSEDSQTVSSAPSRSAGHRRRSQPGKGTPTAAKPPPPVAIKTQESRGDSIPASQMALRKDVPPHLAAVHEVEVRHDIDALVERVRAVAMAENRPTTPGSHIDWAGDEDDSLPDLDDWGITTRHVNATLDEGQNEEISPILADALKPLPEPNSEVRQEEREMETYDAQPEQVQESPSQPSFLPSPPEEATLVPPTTDKGPEQCIVVPAVSEESSSLSLTDGKPPLHPSLPPKPVAVMKSLRARGKSISKPSGLPPKAPVLAAEEALTTNTEGLLESIHAPSADERVTLERVSSASSSERGLAASIHAHVPDLPESHSAPSLLSGNTPSTVHHTHSRSHTEDHSETHQSHTAPPGTVSHRHGRSGASSPLGKHVYTHSRARSTPAGGAGSRAPQSSRPVITNDAISRLARSIGGLGPAPRTQTIPVAKDSTISS